MRLTPAQLRQFNEDGVLILPNLFSDAEVEVLRAAMNRVLTQDNPANIREKKSEVVRTAMGLHVRDEVFARLSRHPRFVEPARQITGQNLYIQQSKINVKEAFTGEVWQWHQDFPTHHRDDGVPRPEALNLHVLLDDVNEFNGPLYFIRGSHRFGPAASIYDTTTTSHPLWVIDPGVVRQMTDKGDLISAKGKAGTALIFGECVAHCSPPNLSPWTRAIFSLILNPVANRFTNPKRPEYIHHRDLTPVTPLHDGCLLDELEPVA
ncbi:phytanoyl-CoA dioxygenase family protein [Paraburkholderia sp.]|uniref:phytanoyl-CoA dioxygenase family protein n=1 Tax=Paraburkholderia sp. TaxID=1926495 RepID=UPI0039E25765